MSFHKMRSSPKQIKRQSLGRIYTTNRLPLSQINHYPKSVLIDQYFLQHDSLIKQQKNSYSQKKKKQKVIKFVGCQYQNIVQIIRSMDSLLECQNRIFMQRQRLNVEEQIMQILKIFYAKVDKLRMQRQSYKSAYYSQKQQGENKQNELNEQIKKLNEQITQLRKQNETLVENNQNEQKKRLFYERQCMMLQQRTKINTNNNINNQTVAESFDLVNRSINMDEHYYLIESSIHENSYNNNRHQHQSRHNRHHKRFSSNNNDFQNDENQHSLMIKPVVNKSVNNSRKNQRNLMTYQSQTQTNLIQTENEEEKNNKITLQEKQKLQIILKKHNLHPNQLGDIIEEYLKDLKEQYQKQFENQQEKRLYLLAKKMDAKIWNKKVKKDIEKIITSKESIKFKD